ERDKPFTINDRRHFTAEGHARQEAEVPPVAAPPAGPPAPEEPAADAPTTDETPSAGPSGAGPLDFAQFLLSLGAQAGMLLSPAEGGGANGAEALEGARQIISILEMLKEKTEGRRTDEESGVLDNLLFQLRLAYVERARRP
ncbi:MAG: DUF1844 domain-containing protein, partial [Betaproteobacteria bacterium]